MRTARSRISGENFGDFLILAPFSSEGASAKPGAVHREGPGDTTVRAKKIPDALPHAPGISRPEKASGATDSPHFPGVVTSEQLPNFWAGTAENRYLKGTVRYLHIETNRTPERVKNDRTH